MDKSTMQRPVRQPRNVRTQAVFLLQLILAGMGGVFTFVTKVFIPRRAK